MSVLISIDQLDEEIRAAYRVEVDPAAPVKMAIDGQLVELLNMSEGGVAFYSENELERRFAKAFMVFIVAKRKHSLKLHLKILGNRKGRYHALFQDQSDREKLLLSQLVVDLQKLVIRKEKEQKRREAEQARLKGE